MEDVLHYFISFHFIYDFTAQMEGYSNNGDSEYWSADGILISAISSLREKIIRS